MHFTRTFKRIEDEILQYHGAIVRCTAKELHKAKFGAGKDKQFPGFKWCVTVDVHFMHAAFEIQQFRPGLGRIEV